MVVQRQALISHAILYKRSSLLNDHIILLHTHPNQCRSVWILIGPDTRLFKEIPWELKELLLQFDLAGDTTHDMILRIFCTYHETNMPQVSSGLCFGAVIVLQIEHFHMCTLANVAPAISCVSAPGYRCWGPDKA